MIKFFRKIRQRLLTENKFIKYLLYAIGEIGIVVLEYKCLPTSLALKGSQRTIPFSE